jgi:hypothetical protein
MSGNGNRKDSPWLDTQTKAILQPTPPEKRTALETSGFTLILLEKGFWHDRLARALERIGREPERPMTWLLDTACPAVVRYGLTLDDAIVGQFELICCDCISVFLRDEVVVQGDSDYLRVLYCQLRDSLEFQAVFIRIMFIPHTDVGRLFCDQFLSSAEDKKIRYGSDIMMRARVFRKKARMMAHWAIEIGVRLAIEE